MAIRLLLPRVLAWRGVWFAWHTRFGPALVFDSADADGTTVRLLNVNGTYQSVCYVDEDLLWDPVCEYHRTWARWVHQVLPRRRERRDAPLRALVMGGGGYSFPKWLVAYRPDFVCEVVEIDPAITRIARERFFLDKLMDDFATRENGRLLVVEGDAWSHLAADTQGYDLIVNDAFSGNRPLGPMETAEGARMVREHLRTGGLYVGNVRTPLEGRKSRSLKEAKRAFAEEFAHVKMVPERPEEPQKVGNNALMAWVSSAKRDGQRREAFMANDIIGDDDLNAWLMEPDCPQCGSEDVVCKDTYQDGLGRTIKVWYCNKCGHTWTEVSG